MHKQELLNSLSPQTVWEYFIQICEIPRASKDEEQIILWLKSFACTHNLDYKSDEIGNVLISKKATQGCENRPSVVLQSHLDMVCEKNSDYIHDFSKDPILPFIEGDWVKAIGTTLGADDGIGIAAQLAVLASNTIQHGPIECLFTVDEETGLSGAFALKKDFFRSTILINLDSEDEGELFIGCAGGIDTIAELPITKCEVPKGYWAFELQISGLLGGHSGDDIDKGHANANVLLGEFLKIISDEYPIYISYVNGGNLRNAIPREAKVNAVVPFAAKENVRIALNIFISDVELKYINGDKNIKLKLESVDIPQNTYCNDTTDKMIKALCDCPNGVLDMNIDMPNLVETSTNLASIKEVNDRIIFTTSQRSSTIEGRDSAMNRVANVFKEIGAIVRHSDGYPGWRPNVNSKILKLTEQKYKDLFQINPSVRAIHAGLECGLFLEKYPNLDMVSFGPTIKGAHSPDERLHIKSVEKFWLLLVAVLESL